MANLKREFQKDDLNKLVPIQLLTTVNASSPVETNLGALIQEGNTKKLKVTFPSDSSAMAFLVGSNRVEDVKISPPGFTEVSFDVPMGSKYQIYVVSKEYEDGFVYLADGSQYRVRNDIPQGGESFEFEIEDQDTTVDLNRSESLKLAVDPTDQTQWYNYSSHYAGGLIWQYSESVDINSDNKYLIYKLDILNHINSLAYTEEVGLVENPTERWQAVRALKVLHDTYNYLKSPQVQSTLDKYDKIRDLYNSMNEFIRSITDDKLDLEIGNDGYKMLYYWAEKRYFADGIHIEPTRHWFNNNGGSVQQDDYDLYYGSIRNKIAAKSMRDWKIKYGATEIYAAMDSITKQAQPFDYDDERIQTLIKYMYDSTGEYAQMDEFFDRYDIPHSTVIRDNGGKIPQEPYKSEGDSVFFSYILGKASLILGDMISFIRDEIEQTEELMSALGDFIFKPQSTGEAGEEEILEHPEKVNRAYNILTEIKDYALLNGLTSLSDIDPEGTDPTIGLDDVDRAIDGLNEIKKDINGSSTNIEHLPTIITDLSRARTYNNAILNVMRYRQNITIDEYNSYRQFIAGLLPPDAMQSFAKVYDYYVNLVGDVEQVGGSQDGTPPLAHEATLQNIRFLKNQLTEINNNVWSSVNGANSVMVGAIHRIEQELFSQGVNYTQTNLTNPFISESDVDVYYSMVGSDKPIPTWTKLNAAPTIIADQGIIMLNLNELKDVGKYLVSIRPKKLKLLPINNTDSELGTIVLASVSKIGVDGLTIYNNTTTSNAYKSWNIQITNQNGSPIGPQRIIVASEKYSDGYVLQVSPKDNLPRLDEKTNYCSIWSNKFEPIMIDLDIVEHNNLTLSYSMYGEREFNKDTGLVRLYDYNGNEYKTLSYGTEDTPTSGGLVEYRRPIES